MRGLGGDAVCHGVGAVQTGQSAGGGFTVAVLDADVDHRINHRGLHCVAVGGVPHRLRRERNAHQRVVGVDLPETRGRELPQCRLGIVSDNAHPAGPLRRGHHLGELAGAPGVQCDVLLVSTGQIQGHFQRHWFPGGAGDVLGGRQAAGQSPAVLPPSNQIGQTHARQGNCLRQLEQLLESHGRRSVPPQSPSKPSSCTQQ